MPTGAVSNPLDWGVTHWLWPFSNGVVPATALLNLTMDATAEPAAHQAAQLLGGNYMRANVPLAQPFGLDDYKNVGELVSAAQNYIENSPDWANAHLDRKELEVKEGRRRDARPWSTWPGGVDFSASYGRCGPRLSRDVLRCASGAMKGRGHRSRRVASQRQRVGWSVPTGALLHDVRSRRAVQGEDAAAVVAAGYGSAQYVKYF
ncbi:hypothetical protein GmRootV15_67310 (plasmid) [Variovorax sp. V15]